MRTRPLPGLMIFAALIVLTFAAPVRAQDGVPGGVIAFVGVDAEDNAALYLLDLASGAVGVVDTPVAPDVDLEWHPDDEMLVFTTADGGYGLLRSLRGCFEAGGTCLDIVEVYPPFMVEQVEWTPDGAQLLLLTDAGLHISAPRARPADISALDTDCSAGIAVSAAPLYLFCAATDETGNIQASVYEGSEDAFEPLYTIGTFPDITAYDIAPDGSAAIGTLETAGDSGFYAPVDGDPARLADYQIHIYDLAFGPEGSPLAIAGATSDSTGDGTLRDDDPGELFLFDVESGALQQIPGFTDARALTWQPGGEHILVVSGANTLSLYTPETSLVTALEASLPDASMTIHRTEWAPVTEITTLPIIPTATPGGIATPIPTPTPADLPPAFVTATSFPTLTPRPTLTPIPTWTPIPTATPGSPIGLGCEYAFVGGGGLPVAIGDTAEVTPYGAAVRLRTAPRLDASMIRELMPGTRMTIRSGPYCGQGYRWWEVQLEGEATIGYVADSDPGGYWIQVAAAPPTEVPESIDFYANTYTINQGDCVTLGWDVEGIKAVYYQGTGVTGHETREECPASTTTYQLRVVRMDDTEVIRQITIFVIVP